VEYDLNSISCPVPCPKGQLIDSGRKSEFTGRQSLHFDVLEAIKEKLSGFPILMHGSSSVPEEEVKRINAAGGKLDPTARGVDENEYLPAAKLGVTKINIDTHGRLVWTRVHREYFRDHPEQFDFRPPGKLFVEEYAKFIAHKSETLGSAGKLPRGVLLRDGLHCRHEGGCRGHREAKTGFQGGWRHVDKHAIGDGLGAGVTKDDLSEKALGALCFGGFKVAHAILNSAKRRQAFCVPEGWRRPGRPEGSETE